MPLLVTMSLMGGISFLFYIIIEKFFNRFVSIRWRRIYLKMNIFILIFPFPDYIFTYRDFLKQYVGKIFGHGTGHAEIVDMTGHFIQITPKGIFTDILIVYVLLAVCLFVGLLVYTQKLFYYVKILKFLSKKNFHEEQKYGKYKKVRIYKGGDIDSPFTVGMIRPIIFLPDGLSKEKEKMIYEHEFAHIKNHDNLWKLVLITSAALHCYNPIVYFLMFRWNVVTEMYCDQCVISDKSNEKIKVYGKMVIDFSTLDNSKRIARCASGFNPSADIIIERIKNMKRDKKRNIFTESAILAVTMFLTSLLLVWYQPREIVFAERKTETTVVYDEKLVFAEVYELGGAPVCIDKVAVEFEDGTYMYFKDNSHEYELRKICIHTFEN